MKEKVILVGAGGHCKIIIESIDQSKYEIIGILDGFTKKGQAICGIPVIGTDEDADAIFNSGIKTAVITIVGNLKIRKKLLAKYKDIGFNFPNIIHKTCYISKSAVLGNGVTILANSCVNAEARLEDYVTVNTGAIVEHEAIVKENSHIAPGAILLGASKVGSDTMIGARSVLKQQVTVGDNCVIGAGSVVLKDVQDEKVVFGNPAKEK